MSGRLARIFATCRAENRAALVAYLMAGDPDFERSLAYFRAALAGGADILEIGVPFSDPIADGPVIQAAAGRALAAGGGCRAALRLAEALRREFPERGLVLMSYLNPLLAAGPDAAAGAAAIDALLPVDLDPDDDAGSLPDGLRGAGLDRIMLLADSTPAERRERRIAAASGFLYYLARRGVTGAQSGLPAGLLDEVRALARQAGGRIPIAVGFGLSRPEDVQAVARVADGVIVGSALVRGVEEGIPPGSLADRVRELHDACQRGPAGNSPPKA